MISGRPKLQDGDPELTATKGDIDALNKRLDDIERLIRCIATDPKACY
jgi:tetrahydromethanopterin S-methyltransferase subunit G